MARNRTKQRKGSMDYHLTFRSNYNTIYDLVEKKIKLFLINQKKLHYKSGYSIDKVRAYFREVVEAKYKFQSPLEIELFNVYLTKNQFEDRYSETVIFNEILFRYFNNLDSNIVPKALNYKTLIKKIAAYEAINEISRLLDIQSTQLAKVFDENLENFKIREEPRPIQPDIVTVDLRPVYGLTDLDFALVKRYERYKYFKVGVALADGSMYDLYKKYGADTQCFRIICRDLVIDENLSNYVGASLKNNIRKENIYRNHAALRSIAAYCIRENIDICERFKEIYLKELIVKL